MQNIDEIMMFRVTHLDDEKAFDYLYNYYSASLFSYIDGFVKNKQDSEDILNECFFDLWVNRKKIEIKKSLKAYLFISARNKSINHLKETFIRKKNYSKLAYLFLFQDDIII